MSDIELGVRLALSLLFGTVVGIGRQWHHKNAGIKTNTLVAVGSTSFALVSQHGFGPNSNPAQIAAGVVTGIGFIGAGVIMRRGGSVQGVNSAATLWATASIGLAVGSGYSKLAWFVLAVVLVAQFSLRWAAAWIDQRSGQVVPHITYRLVVSFIPSASESVRSTWSAFTGQSGGLILHFKETLGNDSESLLEACFGLSEGRVCDLKALCQKIGEIQGVSRVEWSEATTADGEERPRRRVPESSLVYTRVGTPVGFC